VLLATTTVLPRATATEAPPAAPPAVPTPAQAQSPAPHPAPPGPSAVRSLGGSRYQVGAILVDKRHHRLTVPGRVAHLGEAPLEYLAVAPHGLKEYESLLEVDASGSDFNVALILIGLDAALSSRPGYQFDRSFPEGQLLEVAVRFTAGGRSRTVGADEALMTDEERGRIPPTQWVYTGSFVHPNAGHVFAADASGTLIGFVHDPADIIEHRAGLGIGHYGSVRGNVGLLPPIGSPVELVVTYSGQLTDAARR
jgi:hypothetical protein